MVLPRQLVGRGSPPTSPVALLLAFRTGAPSGFRFKSSRWGHPSGSGLSQSSIGSKALAPPSWCMLRVFAMGFTLSGRGLFQISIETKTCLTPLPLWLVSGLRDGVTHFGRVALLCALDRNEGFLHSSILSCFAMGSPGGSSVWFPALDRNEAVFGYLLGVPPG